MVRAETQGYGIQPGEALDEQGRPNQKNQRKGDFGNYEEPRRGVAECTLYHAATRFLERFIEVNS